MGKYIPRLAVNFNVITSNNWRDYISFPVVCNENSIGTGIAILCIKLLQGC